MRFGFPFISVFVVPSDAGDGDDRVVIGPGSRIDVYDDSVLVVSIFEEGVQILPDEPHDTTSSSLKLARGTPDDNAAIFFFSNRSGLGEDHVTLQEFGFGSYDQAVKLQARQSEDGSATLIVAADRSQAPTFRFRDEGVSGASIDLLQVNGGSAPFARLNLGNSGVQDIPLGLRQRVFATADDALAAGTEELADVCVINDLPVNGDRSYPVYAQASFSNPAAAGKVTFRLRYTEDGSTPTTASTLLEEAYCNITPVGSTGGSGHIRGIYNPGSDLDLSVGLFLLANQACTMFGANDAHAYIEVSDEGS